MKQTHKQPEKQTSKQTMPEIEKEFEYNIKSASQRLFFYRFTHKRNFTLKWII